VGKQREGEEMIESEPVWSERAITSYLSESCLLPSPQFKVNRFPLMALSHKCTDRTLLGK